MQNTSNDKVETKPSTISTNSNSKGSKATGKGKRRKPKTTQVVKTSAKYLVEDDKICQIRRTSVPGEGEFSQTQLLTQLDIPHAYKHVVNQVFKISSLLSQSGATQEQIDIGVEKLQKLIKLSSENVIIQDSKIRAQDDDTPHGESEEQKED